MRNKYYDVCLNCERPNCTGDYPRCQEDYDMNISTGMDLNGGDAMMLVSLLAKIGYNRREIATICRTDLKTVAGNLYYGKKKGIISDKIYAASRVKKVAEKKEAV